MLDGSSSCSITPQVSGFHAMEHWPSWKLPGCAKAGLRLFMSVPSCFHLPNRRLRRFDPKIPEASRNTPILPPASKKKPRIARP